MKDPLEHTLDQREIAPTSMRLLVLRVLIESKKALSLTDLEAKFDRADKATLFRTLRTFEKKKLVHAIDDGTGAKKYALCAQECDCKVEQQHIHFHCTNCNETFCLSQTKIPSAQIPVGFEVDSVSMVFKGKCFNCR